MTRLRLMAMTLIPIAAIYVVILGVGLAKSTKSSIAITDEIHGLGAGVAVPRDVDDAGTHIADPHCLLLDTACVLESRTYHSAKVVSNIVGEEPWTE